MCYTDEELDKINHMLDEASEEEIDDGYISEEDYMYYLLNEDTCLPIEEC